MDIRGFRRDVQKKLLELQASHPSGYCYITSLDNREKQTVAGAVSEVSLMNAARHLCERSAELSTDAEVQEYHRVAEERRAKIVSDSKRHVDKELRISVDR